MNERLKRLADQAGVHDDVCSMCPIHELDKFALLIVKECIRIDEENRDAAPGVEIARHFGLEE